MTQDESNEDHDVTDLAPRARARRGLGDYVGLIARGFCMGSADVVPGVSGGTMAFILGIYEELIQSIRLFGRPEFFRPLFRFDLKRVFRVANWEFLAAILAGIGIAVLSFAHLLEWLLAHQPVIVWSFFFGLVLASVVVVAARVSRWNLPLVGALLVGGIGAWLLVGMVPVQTPNDWWFLFISGSVAICAMILPGISGAFILVLLGQYQHVLGAVNQRDLGTLFWVGAGAAVGIITFAQFLGWLFKRHHDPTVALLTGLMLGSLRKVWPWKVDLAWVLDRHGVRVPSLQRNALPELTIHGSLNHEVVVAAGFAALGLILVIVLDRVANRMETGNR